MELKPGNVLHVGGDASVQFGGDRSLVFRVIKVCDRPTYDGWVWLTGYVLDRTGKAVARREIYVQRAGLVQASAAEPTEKRQPSPKPASQTRRSGSKQKAETTV